MPSMPSIPGVPVPLAFMWGAPRPAAPPLQPVPVPVPPGLPPARAQGPVKKAAQATGPVKAAEKAPQPPQPVKVPAEAKLVEKGQSAADKAAPAPVPADADKLLEKSESKETDKAKAASSSANLETKQKPRPRKARPSAAPELRREQGASGPGPHEEGWQLRPPRQRKWQESMWRRRQAHRHLRRRHHRHLLEVLQPPRHCQLLMAMFQTLAPQLHSSSPSSQRKRSVGSTWLTAKPKLAGTRSSKWYGWPSRIPKGCALPKRTPTRLAHCHLPTHGGVAQGTMAASLSRTYVLFVFELPGSCLQVACKLPAVCTVFVSNSLCHPRLLLVWLQQPPRPQRCWLCGSRIRIAICESLLNRSSRLRRQTGAHTKVVDVDKEAQGDAAEARPEAGQAVKGLKPKAMPRKQQQRGRSRTPAKASNTASRNQSRKEPKDALTQQVAALFADAHQVAALLLPAYCLRIKGQDKGISESGSSVASPKEPASASASQPRGEKRAAKGSQEPKKNAKGGKGKGKAKVASERSAASSSTSSPIVFLERTETEANDEAATSPELTDEESDKPPRTKAPPPNIPKAKAAKGPGKGAAKTPAKVPGKDAAKTPAQAQAPKKGPAKPKAPDTKGPAAEAEAGRVEIKLAVCFLETQVVPICPCLLFAHLLPPSLVRFRSRTRLLRHRRPQRTITRTP